MIAGQADSAFGGDVARRDGLAALVAASRAAGTLVIAPTFWDGERGSPLGVSVQGTEIADYVDRFSYPAALAALLDPLALAMRAPDAAAAFASHWVMAVTPGADLRPAVIHLVLHMLNAPEAHADDDTRELVRLVDGLHRAMLSGAAVPRREWAAARARIAAATANALPGQRRQAALRLCEMACWPAAGSQSILAEMFRGWLDLADLEEDPRWSDEDDARKDGILEALWAERETGGSAGETIDYHARFTARAPDLAARYLDHLTRTNSRVGPRAIGFGETCLSILARAS